MIYWLPKDILQLLICHGAKVTIETLDHVYLEERQQWVIEWLKADKDEMIFEVSQGETTNSIQKEKSSFLVIPDKMDEAFTMESIRNRLKENDRTNELKSIQILHNKRWGEQLRLIYKDEVYIAKLEEVALDEKKWQQFHYKHIFSDEEKNKLLLAKKAVKIELLIPGNVQEAFKVQLQLAASSFSLVLAVIDQNAKQFLSGKWLHQVAFATYDILSDHYYHIACQHAMESDEKKHILLYSKGLCRFGLWEVVMLISDQENRAIYESILCKIVENQLWEDENRPLGELYNEEGDKLIYGYLSLDEIKNQLNRPQKKLLVDFMQEEEEASRYKVLGYFANDEAEKKGLSSPWEKWLTAYQGSKQLYEIPANKRIMREMAQATFL